jgi:F-type H+-transporting ATPase subunit gamma
MPSVKDLKKRIASVKNTQQTTKAMKMVSAAKLRRAQEAITSHRPYAKELAKTVSLVGSLPESKGLGERYRTRELLAEGRKPRLLLVLVTSDRGLCGGFNSSVLRLAQRWMGESAGQYEAISMAFVGRKGFEFFRTRNITVFANYPELAGKVSFAKGKQLARHLQDAFLDGQFDEVKFIYNEFRNAATQRVVCEDFLPLARKDDEGASTVGPQFIIKPGVKEIYDTLLERHFSVQAFRILLESQAGEHGARMSAMENATKNAGEMIRKLTLQYNKQRQAGITKELLEIIAGSESQKTG